MRTPAMTDADLDALVERLVEAGRIIERYKDPRMRPLTPENFRFYAAARREIRTSAAALASLRAERDALREAADELRDTVLHGRGPLESVLDGDHTNAVLGAIDDAFAALAPASQTPARNGDNNA